MPLKKFVPKAGSKVVRKATEEEASTLAAPSLSGAVATSFKGPAVATPAAAVKPKSKPAAEVASAAPSVAAPAAPDAPAAPPVATGPRPQARQNRVQQLLNLDRETEPSVADYNDYEDTFHEKVEETPLLKGYEAGQKAHEENNTHALSTSVYMPSTRTAFYKFIQTTYAERFSLPTVVKDKELDPAACEKLMSGGPSRVEPFLYQRFIKEYMRMSSPYRGMVVYHGLGSGKTCSAILASEALYGQSNKRLIVMTPKSLRANFMNDIIFACGFRHFSPTNFWTALPLTKEGVPLIVNEMYARSVMSLSRDYLEVLKARPRPPILWIPDFSKPPSESNFKSLEPSQQDDVMAQINEMITNRVDFISYNGITGKKLKAIACNDPTYFDNAVIVIDEIHNMIRLMNGSIIPYLKERTGAGKHRKVKAEKVEVGRWKPLLCDDPKKNYKRGYLLYRLLCGAKNSKIIGLSGTPLINYPEELGILANVLSGYMDCADLVLTSADPVKAEAFRALAEKDPRVDFIRIDKGDTFHKISLSVFQEGYKKVLGPPSPAGDPRERSFEGVVQSDDPDAQADIRAVVARLRSTATAAGLSTADPTFAAMERLPVDNETFTLRFIAPTVDGIGINEENSFVLKKRLAGLISYYRGAGDNFYPAVTRDETVRCELSDYTALMYYDTRVDEIEAEEKKRAKKTGEKLEAVYALVELFGVNPPPDSYQFRSRALCNFAFPTAIPRPSPLKKGEEKADMGEEEGAYEDDEAADGGASIRSEIEEEEEEAERVLEEEEEEEEEEAAPVPAVAPVAPVPSPESGDASSEESSSGSSSSGSSSSDSSSSDSNSSGSSSSDSSSSDSSSGSSEETTSGESQSGGADEEGTVPKAVKAAVGTAAEAAGTAAAAASAVVGAASSTLEAAIDAVAAPSKALTYVERIRRAMSTLNRNRSKYMNLVSDVPTARLSMYSRKLHEILIRMKTATGPVLVYSQFKTVEGLGVLGIALKTNGYDEIAIERWDGNSPVFTADTLTSIRKGPSVGSVPKRFITFSGDSGNTPVQRAVLINLFNGQWAKLPRGVKALFEDAGFDMGAKYTHGEICGCIGITSAGAEGISLRNVRQVHIMEPYWNMVRIDQVKGRAVRICSHMDLPPEERNVEIYTYISTFSSNQLHSTPEKGGLPPIIRRKDLRPTGVVTTDEAVYLVSQQKALINEKVLKVLKETAVDCKMNQPDNEPIRCFAVQGKNPYLFDPNISRDVVTTVSEYGKGRGKEVEPEVEEKAKPPAKTTTLPKISLTKQGKDGPVTAEYLVGPVNRATMEVLLYAGNDAELTRALLVGKVVPSPGGGQTYTGFVPIGAPASVFASPPSATVVPVVPVVPAATAAKPVSASSEAETEEESE